MVNLQDTAAIQQDFEIAESKLRSLKIKRWLKIDEVALYLGSTREAVKKSYQRGKISANKFCGRLYFDREQLDLLIENSVVGSVPTVSHGKIQFNNVRRRRR